jgi:hypothetical protein
MELEPGKPLEWELIGSPRSRSGSPREIEPDTAGAMQKDEAIVIIMSHGNIDVDVRENKGKYVALPKCVTNFKKKNIAAPGYYSMLDLYYRMSDYDLSNDVMHNGLENSFPQMDDVLGMRGYVERVRRPERSVGWQTDMFGPINMEGECSDGVCITQSKKKIVNKIYSPEGDLPLLFVYKFDNYMGPRRFDLFKQSSLTELFDSIEYHKRPSGEELKKMNALHELFRIKAAERRIETYMIFELVKLLKIKKLSILDLSCAVPVGKLEPEPASYIPLPEDVGLGRKLNKTRRKKEKRKKKRKTRRV